MPAERETHVVEVGECRVTFDVPAGTSPHMEATIRFTSKDEDDLAHLVNTLLSGEEVKVPERDEWQNMSAYAVKYLPEPGVAGFPRRARFMVQVAEPPRKRETKTAPPHPVFTPEFRERLTKVKIKEES